MAVKCEIKRSKVNNKANSSICKLLDRLAQKVSFDPACFKGHLFTILKHKRLVFIHCLKIGMPVRGLLHDLSKFSPAEFYYGVKYYKGDKSPNEGEREAYGYSNAWMHHKGRNRHHFEYWTDYNLKDRCVKPVKMPLKYVLEMFCDRVAASKTYNREKYTDKDPITYFMQRKPHRFIHPETEAFLEKLLKMLSMVGEEKTFAFIRKYRKHHTDY
ncbi:MAG: DUF5662 family protein [Lachnospiraceae bacterium]|nr:DUF5662 family protein [Lachnospiraceae bacterium]